MKRRNFIKSSSALSITIPILGQSSTNMQKMPKEKLLIFQTNWGFQGSNDEFCAAAKKEGYDGIELWWPDKEIDQNDLFAALTKHKLKVGFLIGGNQFNVEEHFQTFKSALNSASKSKIMPEYINCHSGKDFFETVDNQRFIDLTTEVASASGIKICHETHRGRMMFAAHVCRKFMEKNPKLRLTADLSHWCNVHESLLHDQSETVEMALTRTDNIHARVGHQEGPQVNDPRAGEWKEAFDQHLKWWDKIVEIKAKANEQLTILTEFGPPSYLPTVPFTNMPLANQWEINVFMMKLLRERYSK